MSQSTIPNVIIFGETGVGKSSLVNLILGQDTAPTSSKAEGCTFSSTQYQVAIEGKNYNLYDTAGLNEGGAGTVDSAKAVANLYRLVRSLANSGGVYLLVFVIKCGRLTESTQKNYDLFFHAFCEKEVPIVVAVTGCENVEPMDSWWDENKERFERAGMIFHGHACVCTYRGRKTKAGIYSNEEPFEESKGKVEKLIRAHCRSVGWEKPPLAWFQRILNFFLDLLSSMGVPALYRSLFDSLLRSHSVEEATKVIEEITKAG